MCRKMYPPLSQVGVGTVSNYTCIDEGYSFLSGVVYEFIEMKCVEKEGLGKGGWVWMDQGEEKEELPECAVSL